MIHTPNIAKAPIGDLYQDSSEDEVVLEMIFGTLESLDNDDHGHAGYDMADSWDVQEMIRRTLDSLDYFEDAGCDMDDDNGDHNVFENEGYDTDDSRDVNRRRCSTMIHTPNITEASIGDMDQDRSEKESVQDPVRRTLDSLDVENHDRNDFRDTGYDTDESWDVTRRRWARSKGDMGIVRRCCMRNRGTVPTDLPSVPWPLVNKDNKDCQHDDDDVKVAPLTAERTCQQTVDYFGSELSGKYSMRRPTAVGAHTLVSPLLVSQDSPDSVLTFTLARSGQQLRKSATNRTATAA
jgi:hypothetical protein